jgi:hypothetical protein
MGVELCPSIWGEKIKIEGILQNKERAEENISTSELLKDQSSKENYANAHTQFVIFPCYRCRD